MWKLLLVLIFPLLAIADDISTPINLGGTRGEPYLTASDGKLYKIHLCETTDNAGNVVPCYSALGPPATVNQGNGNSGASLWHVLDDTFLASFNAWKPWADANLSTRATEASLSGFKTANHADLVLVDSDILSFKSTNHVDLNLLDVDLNTFKSATHVDLTLIDSDLNLFKTANHSDFVVIQGKQDTTNANLTSFQSANHTDLGTIDTDLNAFKTANHSDLLGVQTRIDTTNTSVGATNETVATNDTTISGLNGLTKRLNQHSTTIEGKLDTVNSNLVTVQGKQDAQTTLLTAGNVSTASIDTKTPTVGQKPMTGSSPVVIASDQSAIPVTQSGAWAVGRTWVLTSGTDSVSSVQSGNWDIRNITGTISLPTGASLASLQTTGNTTLSTIASNQTNASQKTQIVDATSGVVGPVMANGSANHMPVYLPLDSASATLNITTQDLASATTTGYGGQSFIIGNPTASSAASYALNSIQTVMIEIKGIWTGTLAIETSSDSGTTWVPRGIHVVGTAIFSASVNANVIGSLNGSAKSNVRVRATAPITGTAQVSLWLSDNPSNMYVANALKLVDGSATTSTTLMSIKAASTAVVATDTAVVVGISPNNSVAVTQATAANLNATVVGTVTSNAGTNLNTSALALSATQTNGTQKTQVVDASNNVQPSGDVPARASFVEITDQTNTANVKAASTAAVATDKALVVAISPNNTITTSSGGTSVGTPTETSVSCGATTTTLLAAATATKFISVRNPTIAAFTIWINIVGASATVAVPSIDLAPGSEVDFFASENSFLPTAQLNCISSGTASSVTLVYK